MSVDPTPALPLSSAHVARQFARRGDLSAAQFLYGEIATRMMGRLNYIRVAPATLLDAGCGAGANLPLLHEKYPQAAYTGLDHVGALLAQARKQHGTGPMRALLGKMTGKSVPAPRFIEADLAQTGLDPESMDLVWSNMALHWHPRPHDVLAEWRRVLKTRALAMFSCLGPTTLIELRDALASADLQTQTPSFVDMHDFGDLLIEKGFADPVMDQEVLTLTYRTPEKLLEDVRALGGNPSLDRRAALTGKHWRTRLLQALEAQRGENGLIKLSIEVAYGHAWRTGSRRSSATETRLSVDAIGGRRR
ncbi:MAG: methyltransferase domain-containing protein [Burkholderiaceae bacterium]